MPNIIDLFAGVGGLSLGATRAGFDLLAAVEKDPFAIDSHKKNFSKCRHFSDDISKLKGKDLLSTLKIKKNELDGLIGGPPCQGFSAMGAKNVEDGRNGLFADFFRLVKEIKPKFFVAENVLGILHSRYDKTRKEALKIIPKDYVVLAPFKVRASDYGVPTTRTRVFFIGYNPKYVDDLTEESFLPSPKNKPVNVKEALQGLPLDISPDWQQEEDGWQPYEILTSKNFFTERVSGHIPKNVGDSISLERYLKGKEVSGCLGTRHSKEIANRYAVLEQNGTDKVSNTLSRYSLCNSLEPSRH
jgi:DNA (cytosine-5)-methyltransferase 1